jgi:hypothetical protein
MGRWPSWEQKQATFRLIGHDPHEKQEPIHKADARVIVVAGGERAGKSRFAGMEVVSRIPWSNRVGFVGQSFDKARPEMAYTMEALTELGALESRSTPKIGQWIATTATGCELKTVSLERGTDQLTGTGEAYDIVVLCEWGLMPYNAFLAARGRVSETRGVVLAIGTLQDSVGWQADLWRMGQGPNELGVASFSLPSWSNSRLFPGGREDPEIQSWISSLGDDNEVARRIDAMVLPSAARMFPQFSEITNVKEWAEFNPTQDVYLAVDAGYYPSRYAVLAVQLRKDRYGREIVCVVDEIWEHNKVHEDIVKMTQARPWARHVVRIIGGHETKQHQAAASTQEVWTQLWPGAPFEVFDAGRVLDGASRVRWLLRQEHGWDPRLFLSPKCEGTAWEFTHYKRRTDRQGNVISEDPEDRNNDAMDALRNLVVWRYGYVAEEEKPKDERVKRKSQWGNPYG